MMNNRSDETISPELATLINERITRRETELAQAREAARNEQAQRVASEKALIRLQEELSYQRSLLVQQKSALEQELAEQTARINELDQSLQLQRNEAVKLRKRLTDATLAGRSASEQAEVLSQRLAQGEAALAAARAEAQSKEQLRAGLAASLAEKEEQHKTAEAALRKLRGEEQALRAQLDAANQKYRGATEQLALLKERLAQSEAQFAAAEAGKRDGQHQLEQLKLQLLQAKKAATDAHALIERLRQQKLAAENQVTKTRATVSFQLGYLLIHGFKSFRAFGALPGQLLALRRESKRRKAEKKKNEILIDAAPTRGGGTLPAAASAAPPLSPRPAAPPAPTLPPFTDFAAALKRLKVACIMDEFTASAFLPECDLKQLTPQRWQEELAGFTPELLFIESAWRGKENLWGNKVGHRCAELIGIIDWCRTRQIPTVFWNKEDPVHFETFLWTASLFDYVFTTDIDCIHRYKAALGHDRVYLLPFACQPATTNPLETHARKDAFAFAGAYYVRYPERTRDLGNLLTALASMRPVEIFDRNQGKNDPNYQFPPEYRPFIVGHLPFDQIDKAYKGYRYALNLNSIKQSQSMFARRIFELLACNTVTVSNFSRGVRLFFGDLVLTSDDGDEITRRFRALDRDETIRRKFRLAGLRKVMQEHTCQDRLAYVVAKVQGDERPPGLLPRIVVVARAEDRPQLDALLAHFGRQSYAHRRLLLVVPAGFAPDNIPDDAAIRIVAGSAAEASLNELLDPGELVAGMVAQDYYGPNYLLDLALASRYSRAEAIGKVAHYRWSDRAGLTLVDDGGQYRPATGVAARAALLQPALLGALPLRDFAATLTARRIEAAELLGIDEFNYCREGNAPSFLTDHAAAVNDLAGLDAGLTMGELLRSAEGIAPAEAEAGEAPVLTGAALAAYFKPPTGKDYRFSVAGDAWEVESTLADGVHDYLHAVTDLNPAELGFAGEARFHLDVTPGLNVQLALFFLDAQKQRISSVVKAANSNQSAPIPVGTAWIRFGVRIAGSGSGRINALVLDHRSLRPAVIIGRAEELVLTNQYPAYDDLYRNSFVHSRVAAYAAQGVKADVFRLRPAEPLSYHEFQGVDVVSGAPEALHKLLSGGRYRSVLVHFLSEEMWQVLQQHIAAIKVFVWVHGAEIQPWHRRDYNYATEEERNAAKIRSEVRLAFWRGLLQPMPANLKLIFVSHYFAEEVMEDLGFRIPEEHYSIIHNPIDTELFAYHEKPAEQRKKILSIRPYASRKYANDLSVRAILSLSKEPWFDELEFRMIGDGPLFDQTLAPLRPLRNVYIEQRFLNHAEIAALHRDYGIFLCPTRMDAQGVSRDEAMASGLVPITNRVAAIPEFVDAACGILAEPEDATGLAAGIVDLYAHPEKFLAMSKAAGERVRKQSSNERIIKRELDLFHPQGEGSAPAATLHVAVSAPSQQPPRSTIQAFVSIDVEALPPRAVENPLEHLIWGRTGGEEFGIRRICDILRQHKLKGNFLVDLAAALLYGDAAVQEVIDYLLGEGHEVHTHLHSEWVVRKWGLEPYLGAKFYGAFTNLDYDLTRRLLDFSAWKYRQLTGREATVFRPGGLHFSRQTLRAAKDAGFTASSSLYLPRRTIVDPFQADALTEPFIWDNGLIEIPVDFCPDPLSAPFEEFLAAYSHAKNKTDKTFNLILHSYSLARRDEKGHHPAFTPAFEERLQQIFSHLASAGPVAGYDEYLARNQPTHEVPIDLCISSPPSIVTGETYACSTCGALVSTKLVSNGPCPGCGSPSSATRETDLAAPSGPAATPDDYRFEDVRHEDLALIEQEHLPAPILPILCLADQQFRILKISRGEACGYVPYIADGPNLHAQLQRSFLPFPEVAEQTVAHLFQMNPACNVIRIGNCYTSFDRVPGAQSVAQRKTFILDLPDSFETYRRTYISRHLRLELERLERRLQRTLHNYTFEVLAGDNLPFERFCNIVKVIALHLKAKNAALNRSWEDPYTDDWLKREYPIFRDKGLSSLISTDGKPIAMLFVTRTGVDYYAMASGFDDAYDGNSIGKVLLYRHIEKIIEHGGKYLHLGGGDFGYKTRFGAKEVPLYNAEIRREGLPSTLSLEQWLRRELDQGVSITEINRMIGRNAEVVLGQAKFEEITGVDFIAGVNHEDLGIDNECRHYQVSTEEAFMIMMKHVPDPAGRTFLDVGCGKGMMLYCATRFGFRKYMGLDVSSTLVNIAQENFRKLNLAVNHELIVGDVRQIDPQQLNEADVFYLYNPFSANILAAFLEKLDKSIKLAPRPVWIVYCNARNPEVLLQHGYTLFREFLPGSSEWRFSDYSAIFRSQQ